MTMNRISDDELNQVNGGTNVGMEDDNSTKKDDILCPICGAEVKTFSGTRMTCKKGHTFSETDLKIYSGGKTSGSGLC